MPQDQQRQSRTTDAQDDELAPMTTGQATPAATDASLDAFLDEIDGVLETNAQEFVTGFVQKGGQ